MPSMIVELYVQQMCESVKQEQTANSQCDGTVVNVGEQISLVRNINHFLTFQDLSIGMPICHQSSNTG